jgi:hypothetical protein
MTRNEFIKKIRTKYPQYNNIDDNTLFNKIIEKYPVYKNQITDFKTQETPKQQEPVKQNKFATVKISQPQKEEYILIDPITKLKFKLFRHHFWWIYYPVLFFIIYQIFKILNKIVRHQKNNISLSNLKTIFITINIKELKVGNVHKRLCQFLSLLFITIIIKKNHFEHPSYLFIYLFLIIVTWCVYFIFNRFSNLILSFLIKSEKTILFLILMNLIHQIYSYFFFEGTDFSLCFYGFLPFAIYFIIFVLNHKTTFIFPWNILLRKINHSTNFYIQQNIYITFLLLFSYFFGDFTFSYICYIIVIFWMGLLLSHFLFYSTPTRIRFRDRDNEDAFGD